MTTTYPRTYQQALDMGQHLNERDWNAMHAAVNGTTVYGIRCYPFNYIIRKNGDDYEAISSAHNLVYGGADDAGSVDGADAAAVINAAATAAGVGGKLFFKGAVYTIAAGKTVTFLNYQTIEGEGSRDTTGHTGTVFSLAAADSIIDVSEKTGIKMLHLTIDGNGVAKGLLIGDDGGASQNHLFIDVTWTACTYGLYNDVVTTGFYDSAFYSCHWISNAVGIELKELQNQFYQCWFRTNTVAVEFGSSTTGFWPQFNGCVFSGNDYDFDVNAPVSGVALTCSNCWFESEGDAGGDPGDGNVFKQDGGAAVATNGLIFSRCYFSATTKLDISWVDYASYHMKHIDFIHCNFQGWDDLTNFTLNTGRYPHFTASSRRTTLGAFVNLLCENCGGSVEITGNGTITHGLITTPTGVVTTANSYTTYVDELGDTTFKVHVMKHNDTDGGTEAGTAQYVHWTAFYNPT